MLPSLKSHGALPLTLLALAMDACRHPSYPELPGPAPGCRTAIAAESRGALRPVSWILAPDSQDRAPLDRWCAAVGPAVTANLPAASSDGVDSLAVITWNTHVGGGDVEGLVRDLRAGRLTADQPVEHFVLLLQEVHREGPDVPRAAAGVAPRRITAFPPEEPRRDIVETARRLGLELYYVPSMANGRAFEAGAPEDRGNAILSTVPLEELAAIELPYEAQRRVAAAATLRGITTLGRAWRLRVVSVHLDHRSRWPRVLASLGPGRGRQARALLAALGTDGPAVLGGDLNTWSVGLLEGAVPVLRRHFATATEPATGATYASSWGFNRRLDHLMFRLPADHAVDAWRLDGRRGSDHYPVFGWVRFAR